MSSPSTPTKAALWASAFYRRFVFSVNIDSCWNVDTITAVSPALRACRSRCLLEPRPTQTNVVGYGKP